MAEKLTSLFNALPYFKCPGGRVVSAPDRITRSRVRIPLEAEFSYWLYGRFIAQSLLLSLLHRIDMT